MFTPTADKIPETTLSTGTNTARATSVAVGTGGGVCVVTAETTAAAGGSDTKSLTTVDDRVVVASVLIETEVTAALDGRPRRTSWLRFPLDADTVLVEKTSVLAERLRDPVPAVWFGRGRGGVGGSRDSRVELPGEAVLPVAPAEDEPLESLLVDEGLPGVLSAWATPDPVAKAAPTPSVKALAPNHIW